jgi:hypothetical protein
MLAAYIFEKQNLAAGLAAEQLHGLTFGNS